MRIDFATLAQLIGLGVLLGGLYMLVGTAWTMVAGGGFVLAFATALEIVVSRQPREQAPDNKPTLLRKGGA